MKQISKCSHLFSIFLLYIFSAQGALAEKNIFGVDCSSAASPLNCWQQSVFSWAQRAMLVVATVVIIFAGVIYMTSAGNPERVTLSKKLIYGALTGVAVIILGRFFLKYVIGVPWLNQ